MCVGTLGFLAASFAYAAASAKAPEEETYAPLAGEEVEEAPEQRTGGFRGVAVALTLSICVAPAAGAAAAQHFGAFATLAGAAGVAAIARCSGRYLLCRRWHEKRNEGRRAAGPARRRGAADALARVRLTRWWRRTISAGNIATQYLARDPVEHGRRLVHISLLGAAAAVAGTLIIEPLARKYGQGTEFSLNLLLARAGCLVAAGHLRRICLTPGVEPRHLWDCVSRVCDGSLDAREPRAARGVRAERGRRGRARSLGRPRVRVGTRRAGLARLFVRSLARATRARPTRSTARSRRRHWPSSSSLCGRRSRGTVGAAPLPAVRLFRVGFVGGC